MLLNVLRILRIKDLYTEFRLHFLSLSLFFFSLFYHQPAFTTTFLWTFDQSQRNSDQTMCARGRLRKSIASHRYPWLGTIICHHGTVTVE